MRLFANAAVVLMLMLVPCQTVLAQSAAMPLPGVVLRDADGKVIGQLRDISQSTPSILLNIDGAVVPFWVYFETGRMTRSRYIYFSGDACQGTFVAIQCPLSQNWDFVNDQSIEIMGPDDALGTYRVFRSTSTTPGSFWADSRYQAGTCYDTASVYDVCAAEEVIPNPLAGFHGPTLAEPERTFTVTGGDKLP